MDEQEAVMTVRQLEEAASSIGRGGRTDIFTVETSDVEGCPLCTAEKPKIYVPREMYEEWTKLAGHFSCEWLAYVTGEIKGLEAEVDGFYFPPQVANGAHCENVESVTKYEDRTIGAIHSHVKMKAFWSKEDKDHQNWPVEMVINAYGHILGLVRVKLECGRHERLDSKVIARGTKTPPSRAQELVDALKKGEENAPRPAVQPAGGLAIYQPGRGWEQRFLPWGGRTQ